MSNLRTISPTSNNPLLVMQYPMYHGSYCPTLLHHSQHTQTTRVGDSEYQEAIFVSHYTKTVHGKDWSKFKAKSHPNATICLLLVDQNNNPTISSIFINQVVGKLDYAGHPNYSARSALTVNELNTMASTNDIYNFVVNPAHSFNPQQSQLLKRALLQRFPSDHPQFLQAMLALDRQPDVATTQFPTLPIPDSQDEQPNFLQIVHTTEQKPWVIPNYPQSYGVSEHYEFWVKTINKPNGIRKEVAHFKIWDKELLRYSAPKRKTPSHSTICILRKDNNPLSPQYGLPNFEFVNLGAEGTDAQDVYEFALRNYFTLEQRSLLCTYLIRELGEASQQVQSLNTLWSTQPIVPPTPQ